MTTRSDLTSVLADIDATIGRVRGLSPHPSRSAALHSLATARGHLERMREGRAATPDPDSRPSSPPPENAVVRETASSAFRAARSILRQAKLLP